MRNRLTRAWRRLEAFSERPAAAAVLVGIALVEYALVSIAFPLAAGRDLGTYLRASFELRADEVVLPQALLMRAPVTGVVAEALLALGPLAAELAMALLYALSVLCWWRVARTVGVAPGIALAALASRVPGLRPPLPPARERRAVRRRVRARRAAHRPAGRVAHAAEEPPRSGSALALLVLIRPVSQVLVVLAPLLLLGRGRLASAARGARRARRRRGRASPRSGPATTPCAPTTSPWCAARVTGFPLYRAFVVDRIVSPENGEASRELARAVAGGSAAARAVPLVRDRPRHVLHGRAARGCTRT